jgi:light-regulated signal transduction histidine kinase (bacteriophytochrome)
LRKANQELKQFAQFASHDLKTPLATVANLCEEVLDEFGGEVPAEARQMIEAAHQAVFRMSATIDELLQGAVSAESNRAGAQ